MKELSVADKNGSADGKSDVALPYMRNVLRMSSLWVRDLACMGAVHGALRAATDKSSFAAENDSTVQTAKEELCHTECTQTVGILNLNDELLDELMKR